MSDVDNWQTKKHFTKKTSNGLIKGYALWQYSTHRCLAAKSVYNMLTSPVINVKKKTEKNGIETKEVD